MQNDDSMLNLLNARYFGRLAPGRHVVWTLHIPPASAHNTLRLFQTQERGTKQRHKTLCLSLSIGFRASERIKAHQTHPSQTCLSAAQISYRAGRWWEKPQIAARPTPDSYDSGRGGDRFDSSRHCTGEHLRLLLPGRSCEVTANSAKLDQTKEE